MNRIGGRMDQLVLLVACFLLGMGLRRSGRLPANAHSALNGFVMNVSLPALTLLAVHRLALDRSLLAPASMAWVLFGLGCGCLWLAARALRLPRATTGALILTGSLANTSFVGLPMIEAHFGAHGVGLGIVIDQAGTYLVLSTLGLWVAMRHAGAGAPSPRAVVRRVLGFAPFLAFLLALATTPFAYPAWLETLLGRLGATLVPIALVSVGYQIQFGSARGRARDLGLGLGFKLLLGPALIALIYAGLLGGRGETTQIVVFEAAMPPQIGAAIVAMEHDLDPQLVTLMVGIGIPLSFLTLYGWRQALALLA